MIRLVLALCLAPFAAMGQNALPCSGIARADSIPEPWAENTRTFANGEVRLAVIDTVEPAVGAYWLLVMHPPRDELGLRHCTLVGHGNLGFAGMDFAALNAGYDPALGLTFTLPVQAFNPETGGIDPHMLSVTVNQSTGRVDAGFQ